MINIPKGVTGAEFDLYISGYKYCENLITDAGCTIDEAVVKTIDKYCVLIENVEIFRAFLFSEVTAFTESAVGVIKPDITDKSWWSDLLLKEDFQTQYWQRYHDYMNHKPSWSIDAIQNIDTSTDEVMNALADPTKLVANDRMGLLFGYVQSGKTAHYIGLINKAIDAGYRIIIVLTGIHNSLRSQTQSRIDEEVLGYETSLENIEDMSRTKNAIGVGVGRHNQVTEIVQSITTRDEKGDVNKKTEGVSMMPPFIIVTKKNAPVLRRILRYFRKSPYAEVKNGKKIIPAKYPALIIDDEADQASVNTNATYDENGQILDDYNPTTINGLVREVLQLFECRSYAGYTATPFANIFIPPHVETEKYGSDLYPRDFIFRTPRANSYVGAREFFGLRGDESMPAMPLCRDIVEGASYLGKGAKYGDPVGELPAELKMAVKYFLISTAMRNCRGQQNKPNTMLVHIVRFTPQQNTLKKRIKQYYADEVENFIQFGDQAIHDELRSIWLDDYCKTTSLLLSQFSKYMSDCPKMNWENIWEEIQRIVRKKEITIYSVNGKSEDSLLYKKHEGKPFNVIVIGGDKLSRGLTLEGLTISYFTRSSNTYDTLMQMGRWFGFRPGYLDACRLFTTKGLKADFMHISMATEDLAGQFDFMNDIVQTPMEFGLRVASHPTLEITSKNKMRTGVEVKRDFSCKLSQTRVFDIDGNQYDHNFDAVENLLNSIAGCRITAEKYKQTHEGREAPGQHFFWENVSGYHIANFFEDYETSRTATRSNSKYMADYIRTMNHVGGATNWTVCLINISRPDQPAFNIADVKNVGAGIFREEGHGVTSFETTCSIHTMTSAGHEYYDYKMSELEEAETIKEKAGERRYDETVNEYIRKKTRDFKNGLLLLYPIADAGDLTKNKDDHKTPFGFAAVFPDRNGLGNLQPYRMTDIAREKENDEFYI